MYRYQREICQAKLIVNMGLVSNRPVLDFLHSGHDQIIMLYSLLTGAGFIQREFYNLLKLHHNMLLWYCGVALS